ASTAPTTAMVHLSEFKIEPGDVTVAAGGTLQVMNLGTTAHNLAIKDTQLASPMVNAGGSANLSVSGLSAGTYTLFCQVAGHEQAGMKATMRIIDAAGTGGPSAAPAAAAAA